jgi:hypothetical protein
MARKNYILETLKEKHEVVWRPHGNSMVPRIYSGNKVKVVSILPPSYRVGDIVYAKVKGSYYLHLLTAINPGELKFQISNNHGYVNGWANISNVFGVCTEINDKIILTKQDLIDRFWNRDGKSWVSDKDINLPLAVPGDFKITPDLKKNHR